MKIYIFMMFFILNYSINHASDPDSTFCPILLENTTIQAQTGGLYKPSSNSTGEYFKALIVYAQISSNTSYNSVWESESLPDWSDDIIDSSPSSSYNELTVSDYWNDMSMGNFDFIGDVYPNLVLLDTVESIDYRYSQANRAIIDVLDADPNLDFSDYDSWSFNSSTQAFEFIPDGIVDMIIIIYRNPSDNFGGIYGNFTGVANLGSSDFTIDTNDGVRIENDGLEMGMVGSGITIKEGLRGHINTLQTLAHEYGHYLFGSNHTNTAEFLQNKDYLKC